MRGTARGGGLSSWILHVPGTAHNERRGSRCGCGGRKYAACGLRRGDDSDMAATDPDPSLPRRAFLWTVTRQAPPQGRSVLEVVCFTFCFKDETWDTRCGNQQWGLAPECSFPRCTSGASDT